MNVKALAAVAITLIVCVPLGLGYAMASETEEVTEKVTDGDINVSNYLTNASDPYFAVSTSPANNTSVMQYERGAGWELNTVDYVSTGTNYSPIQISDRNSTSYSDGRTSSDYSHTLTAGDRFDLMSSLAYQVHNVHTDAVNIEINLQYSELSASIGTPTFDFSYYYNGQRVDVTGLDLFLDNNFEFMTDGEYLYLISGNRGDGTTYSDIFDAVGDNASGARVLHISIYNNVLASAVTGTITGKFYSSFSDFTSSVTGAGATTYSILGTSLDFLCINGNFLKDEHGNLVTSAVTAVVSGKSWSLSGGHYSTSGTVSGDVRIGSSDSQVEITYLTASNSYADSSYGWTVPTTGTTTTYSNWFNFQDNDSVRMVLDISGMSTYQSGSHYTELIPYRGTTNSSSYAGGNERFDLRKNVNDAGTAIVEVRRTPGDWEALGVYTYVEVDLSRDGWTVYGLSALPSMDSTSERVNSLSGTWDSPSGDYIRSIGLINSSGVVYRVDSADIRAGTYPVTRDYTLTPYNIKPTDEWQVTLSSIGIYGTSIAFNGTAYEVTGRNANSILLDGKETELLHSTFAVRYAEDGTRHAYIDDVDVGTVSDSYPAITFNGTWSLTARLAAYTEESHVETHWQPGEFAFDKSDYVICALGISVLAFVICGMSGARNGAKIGLLALGCGGMACGLIMLA